jgi:hypothetical protein
MKYAHLIVGLLTLVAFLASGQYMDRGYDHLRGLDHAARMLFRSAHIYLLFSALLNLALGLYLTERPDWRCWLQWGGSVLLLATPVLFAVAFLAEPWLTGLERPYAQPGIYLSLAGMLLHLIGSTSPRVARRNCGAAE